MTRAFRLWLCLWAFSAMAQPQRTVTLWHAYVDGPEHEGINEAVEAFQKRHPDIHVEQLVVAFGAFASKLEAAIPAGHGPDLFLDSHERLGPYRAAGLVQPLGLLPEDERTDFDPGDLTALSLEGERYGLPIALKCAALFINEDLLKQNPVTLEALEALRSTLPRGVFPLALEVENAYYAASVFHAYGARLLDERGQYAFKGPQTEAAVTHLRQLVREGTVPDEASSVLIRQLFSSGQAATAVSGPWMAPMLPASLRWRVAPLPKVEGAGGKPMRPFLTIEGVYLSQGARDLEASRALLHFLAGPEGSKIRALKGGQVVASRKAWEDPALQRNGLLSTFRQAAREAVPMPSHLNMYFTFPPAQQALRKVLREEMEVGPALKEGAHRFEDVSRPAPLRRSPMWGLLAVGVALAACTYLSVRKTLDPAFRQALRSSLPAYRYVAHAALLLLLLVILPLLVGAVTSFFAGRGMDLHYVGLANYVEILTARGGELFGHGSFWFVLAVTCLWTVVNVILQLVLGVSLGLLLNRPSLKLKALYRVLLILPWAVPTYVTALSWKGMFHRQLGAVNTVLAAFGVEPISWFARFSTAFSANVSTNVWLGFPFMMVVTLAALSAIPQDVYEAASVDGASAWQRFKLITLPLLAPALAPSIAMGAMWTFNMFNVIFLVSGGEPDGSTEILVSEAYRWAFTRSQQYGYAAAYVVLIFFTLLLGTRLLRPRRKAHRGLA